VEKALRTGDLRHPDQPGLCRGLCLRRRPTEPTRQQPGRRATAWSRKPMAEWFLQIHDAYRPYYYLGPVSLAHQARLHENASAIPEHASRGRGVPRQGAACCRAWRDLRTLWPCAAGRPIGPKPAISVKAYPGSSTSPCVRFWDGPTVEAFVITSFFAAIQHPNGYLGGGARAAPAGSSSSRASSIRTQINGRAMNGSGAPALRRSIRVSLGGASKLERDWNDRCRRCATPRRPRNAWPRNAAERH